MAIPFHGCSQPNEHTDISNETTPTDISEQETQTIHYSDEEIGPQKLTAQSLFEQHILKGSATFHISPCCTLVSTFGDCHDYKRERLIRFFQECVKIKEGKKHIQKYWKENLECLSQLELVVLGNYPFNELGWQIFEDIAILGLVSYYSNTCNTRGCELEFDKSKQDIQTLSPALDPTLKEEVVRLFNETKKEWEEIKKNQDLLHRIQAGISLVNVLNIGTGNAVCDFVPILNRYCKWSMHLACYKEDDELADIPPEECHANPTYIQALKCLKGCVDEEQVIMATRLECDQKEANKPRQNDNIEQAIKNVTGISEVEHLSVPEFKTEDTKRKLEETVVHSQFHSIVYLRELLLLQVIRKKSSDTFWMKRSDIEVLAKQLKFVNGNVNRFLRTFTLFGYLFHAHDIPALNEYVITDIFKFVQQMQQLYNKPSADRLNKKYGLFKYEGNEDMNMIFQFLVNLGIALHIKPNQIRLPTLKDIYIPSARCMSNNASIERQDDSIVISFDKYAAENLQVCLCHELFQTGGQLVPKTGDSNVTVVEFQGTEIEFKESVKDVRITLLNKQTADVPRKIEIFSRVLPRYPNLVTPSKTKLSYKISSVSENLGSLNDFKTKLIEIKNNTPCYENPEIGDPMKIGRIAVLLADKYSGAHMELIGTFKLTPEQFEELPCGNKMRILYMLMEYLKKASTQKFNKKLKALGIQEDDLL